MPPNLPPADAVRVAKIHLSHSDRYSGLLVVSPVSSRVSSHWTRQGAGAGVSGRALRCRCRWLLHTRVQAMQGAWQPTHTLPRVSPQVIYANSTVSELLGYAAGGWRDHCLQEGSFS